MQYFAICFMIIIITQTTEYGTVDRWDNQADNWRGSQYA